MSSPASIGKHPIHPMVVPFPIALWIFSFVCDVVYALDWGGIFWKDMAFVSMAGGVVGALVAAVPGYLDYRSLTALSAAQRIGRWHMALNLSIAVLFTINLWLRVGSEASAVWPVILSLVSIALLGISGWLGGELVYVHGVAVDQEPQVPVRKGRDRAA
jgi:uncharacterized membrane protein